MKRQQNKLTPREQEQEQSASQHQSAGRQTPIEFETPEAALRHDAAQTPVPPSVGERLRESVAREPAPARSWWRRIFSK